IVQGLNNRSLAEHSYTFLLVDALVLLNREEGRVRYRAAMIAGGIIEVGYGVILGLMLGDCDSEACWRELFGGVKFRGLRGVDFVVSDSHGGLVKALQTEFQGCTRQRSQTHYMPNIFEATPKAMQKEVYKLVRSILDAHDHKKARMLMNEFVEEYAEKSTKDVKVLDEGFDDVTEVLVLPDLYRRS
ncbi:transposase, partial [Hydrogenibacillus schlegelii]|uniref:transposase n=1 Tax=Hydrogenibacillus schlegelii TaxID=1484 RepID=UPI0034A042CA